MYANGEDTNTTVIGVASYRALDHVSPRLLTLVFKAYFWTAQSLTSQKSIAESLAQSLQQRTVAGPQFPTSLKCVKFATRGVLLCFESTNTVFVFSRGSVPDPAGKLMMLPLTLPIVHPIDDSGISVSAPWLVPPHAPDPGNDTDHRMTDMV